MRETNLKKIKLNRNQQMGEETQKWMKEEENSEYGKEEKCLKK